jgi:nitrogen fixation NifU-like protein
MDANLRREIILDNYSNPANKGKINSDKYIKVNSNNESCIDNIDLWVLIEDGIIKDIKFDGEACAISTASTSIMTKELIGKTIKEAEDFIQNFNNMINEEPFNSEILEEANAFDEIYKQANRKTCATLPYKGIQRAIEKYNQE